MPELPNDCAYTKRFDAVLAYIEANLEGDLSVKTLSHVANFPAFHFHRQFTAFGGVPVSPYAVVRHAGSPDHIGETIYPIYRDWLPGSGEELRDQPLVFHYLTVYPETPQDQWQTVVYVPLL